MRSPRPPLWLTSLILAAFAVQTDDFIIVGVLPDIAEGTGVSVTAAGQLVTVYSLVYALTAPVWVLLPVRVPRHRAMTAALGVFAAANFAVPLVDGYPLLVALRVVAALSAAVVLPTAIATAGAQAPPDRRGRYLATVMTGLTGAVLIGVPAGTWIGAALGWEATFVFAGMPALGALALAARTLPAEAGARGADAVHAAPGGRRTAPGGAAVLPASVLNRPVAVLLAVTVLSVAGNLAFQTYLSVYAAGVAGVTPALLGLLLVGAGAGGLAGTRASGVLVDRFGGMRALVIAGGLFCAAMAALALLWPMRPVPLLLVGVLVVVWSAAAWAVPPAVQALLLDRAGAHAAHQAVAINSSAVYIGAALGGAAGGTMIAHSPALVPACAALSMALALAISPLTRTAVATR